MLRYIQILLILLICLSTFSCSYQSDELNTAEGLMETAPDSALQVLQSINRSRLIRPSDKALYALLMSQAMDKNDIKVESDSLISLATQYYDDKDPLHAGYAWFYLARCANNRGNAPVQADALLKAQTFATIADNDKLLGLVYGDKGNMYKTQQQMDSSIC